VRNIVRNTSSSYGVMSLMKAIAIEKAAKRLADARYHADQLQPLNLDLGTAGLRRFSRDWFDFLASLDSIMEILRAGGRGNPKSRQWVGSRENARAKDPLMQYLHQARNCDTHGLDEPAGPMFGDDEITGFTPISVGLRSLDGVLTHHDMMAPVLKISETSAKVGDTVEVCFKLRKVVDDRFGTEFEVPGEHMGAPLADISPIAVAKLGLAYYEKLLSDAKALV